MQASKTNALDGAARKPFGPLALYKNRVFLSANEKIELEFIDELKRLYRLDDLEIKVVALTRDGRTKEFRYIEVPGLPRIFLIYLESHAIGIRKVTDVYELAYYDGGATSIVYVHDSALTLFKLATLHNFPCALFHTDAEFKTYLGSMLIGNDSNEMNFILGQQQMYVQKKIKCRQVFADDKREAMEQRRQQSEQRAQARATNTNTSNNDKKETVKNKVQPKRKTEKEDEKKPQSKGKTEKTQPKRGASEKKERGEPKKTPPKRKSEKKESGEPKKDDGWEETKNSRTEKTRESPTAADVTISEQRSVAKSSAGAYVEALTRATVRENRPEETKQTVRPQWSLPSDATQPSHQQMVAPVPMQAGAIFGIPTPHSPWQDQPSTGLSASALLQQLTPEMISKIQAIQAVGSIYRKE